MMQKYQDSSLSPEERASDLLARMNLDEKFGQIQCYNAIDSFLGKSVEKQNPYGVGQVCILIATMLDDVGSAAGLITRLQKQIMESGKHHIPAIFHIETLTGVMVTAATSFPCGLGQASTWDPEQQQKMAACIARQGRAMGISHALAPVFDICRDPRFGRMGETYGEDPYLTSRLGVNFVKGIQGEEEYLRAAACAKHFAVHSGPESLRHEFDARVSEKDMEETYLPAFKALVKEGRVEGVMGAYNRVNGEPSCASEKLMGKLREWGFDGYFVSDCWAIRDFHTTHKITDTAPQSAAMALKAGCDVNCGNTYLHILAALEEGLITKQDIRTACIHALRTRIRLGQLDDNEFDDLPFDIIACDGNKALSLEAAEKSMVLLHNDGILPLDKSRISSIAVIGPNADSRAALLGNYNGTPDRSVTFLEGIQDAFDGRVYYAEGCQLFRDRTQGLALPGDRYAEAVAA